MVELEEQGFLTINSLGKEHGTYYRDLSMKIDLFYLFVYKYVCIDNSIQLACAKTKTTPC